MAAILNSTILESAILAIFDLKLTHTCQDLVSHHLHKKKLHSHFYSPLFAQKKKTSLIHSQWTW